MLDFITLIIFIVLVGVLFKKFCIPVLKEEVKRAKTLTKNIELEYEVLKLEKEKLELELKKYER